MLIFLYFISLIGGTVLLIYGADFFVTGASSIAKKLHISPLIIGVTIVAIGTSLPELAVSISSSITAFRTHSSADISLGNVIGSNIANISLIMGVGLLFGTIDIKKNLKFDLFFFVLSSLLLVFFLFFFDKNSLYSISFFEALVLFIFMIVFIVLLVYKTKKDNQNIVNEAYQENTDKNTLDVKIVEVKTSKAIILFFIGLVGVVVGGVLTTYGAENLSVSLLNGVFGIDITKAKTLIGLSVVAIGTSLPELVTSVVALKKKETEISIGNVVGSNIFNILLILGLAGIINPLNANLDVLFDSLICLGITIIFAVLLLTSEKLGKKTGLVFLSTYIIYITFIILRALEVISIW